MDKVISADGTSIAYDRFGAGQPVIVVAGALCDRARTRPLAEEMARHFTVFNYDRRGRGDSGDTPPYAVEREIEDLAALAAAAGGTAALYGHSSGAGLVLRAAASGLPIRKFVLHEPPYVPDGDDERRGSQEYAQKLAALLSAGRRGDAVALFMTIVGTPPAQVRQMRTEPWWADLEAIAPSLAHDAAVMGDVGGGTVPFDLVRAVTVPGLVLSGAASYPWMTDTGRQIAEALPDGRHRLLDGQEHAVPPEVLVPVLAEFLAD